ncbi:MAG: hypothetical protein P8074_27170 [Anaerolineales bacterium]|jgi:hypothetical protein
MAEEVVATFSGPLNSYSINMRLENASHSAIRGVGISGRTAKFPITWDSFGVMAGPAILTSTVGLDSEVVFMRLSNYGPGDTLHFNGIDPDFTGDNSSGVRVLDITGARAVVLFADGDTGFGEFEPTDDGTLRAIITK